MATASQDVLARLALSEAGITTSPLAKKKMIESQANNGKCYVRLIPMLHSYRTCPIKNLEDCIVSMTNQLGSNPLGIDALTELINCDAILRGANIGLFGDAQVQVNVITGAFSSRLMQSGCRFTWEELGGIHHIGSFLEHDNCPEVYCEHGWSARFIVCLLSRHGVHVGADDSFSQFLESREFECASPNKTTTDKEAELNEEIRRSADDFDKCDELTKEILELQSRISSRAQGLMGHQDDQLELDVGKLLSTRMKQWDASDDRTISPLDSSSHIGRYTKEFLPGGTIYDMPRRGKTQLTVLPEETSETAVVRIENGIAQPSDVLAGFVKTNQMEKLEKVSLSKVKPINGLCKPFTSDRLNLLIHFHTAIDGLKPKHPNMSHYDALIFLNNFEAITPSEELAHQMIIRTFCFKTSRVIANPFKFPFLEIGMLLSDDCLIKCLDLLRLEYKTLWFESMKSLCVPSFHSDFRSKRESRLSTNPVQVQQQRKRSSKSKSTLSFVRE